MTRNGLYANSIWVRIREITQALIGQPWTATLAHLSTDSGYVFCDGLSVGLSIALELAADGTPLNCAPCYSTDGCVCPQDDAHQQPVADYPSR
jgi:hypothetical protein